MEQSLLQNKQTKTNRKIYTQKNKTKEKTIFFVFWHLNRDLMYKITGIYRLLLKTIKRYNKGNAKRGISPCLKI